MLEDSEKNEAHLSAIKNVTDNGSMLMKDDNEESKVLCSQDVLQRLKLFYDDEDD